MLSSPFSSYVTGFLLNVSIFCSDGNVASSAVLRLSKVAVDLRFLFDVLALIRSPMRVPPVSNRT